MGYVAVLLAVSCAILVLGQHAHDVIVQRASTNLHNLAHGHVGTLLGSALVVDAGPLYFWLPDAMSIMLSAAAPVPLSVGREPGKRKSIVLPVLAPVSGITESPPIRVPSTSKTIIRLTIARIHGDRHIAAGNCAQGSEKSEN